MKFWQNRFLGAPLWPLSLIYGAVVRFRNALYDRNVLRTALLDAKVISIGNITVGGSGKTPLVEKIAALLKGEGFRVAVVSRGYRRKSRGTCIVSDGEKIRADVYQAGDEPMLLAQHLSGIPVVVGKNRTEAGQLAIETWRSDMIILDDGFQHRRLRRDADMVVLNANNPWGNGWLLPAGPLREPVSGLRRANSLVLTNNPDIPNSDGLKGSLRRWSQAPIVQVFYHPSEWISIKDGKPYPLKWMKEKSVYAFTGIGNPDSFMKTLETLRVKTVGFSRFPDHHWYSLKDLKRLADSIEMSGAEAVVTTEKDGVKISTIWEDNFSLFVLKVGLKFKGGNGELKKMLRFA